MRVPNRLKQALSLLLLTPGMVLLSACQSNMALKNDGLVSANLTRKSNIEVYPEDRPSVPDGKVWWTKENCASCHGATGNGGSAPVDLADKNWMRKQKPIEQFMFVAYGKPGTNHPALYEKYTKRQMWDLVFYTRSLAVPELKDDEIMAVDPVFGSNCAVCHGKKGKGDGPLAHGLEPQPANFNKYDRFYDRTDDTLYDHIANGIKWEGMPNFLGKEDAAKNIKFDEAYIWKLVQYVRNFHETNMATLPEDTAAPKTGDKTPSK
ncbi:MAG TPA: c-type cytochrome [Drouetiella sp.]